MRRILSLLLVAVLSVAGLLLIAGAAIAGPLDDVTVTATSNPDDRFTPANVAITVGDTVTWVNGGGFHNVVAQDGSFTSGNPSSQAWTFQHTFTTPGTYTYVCTPHASQGMVGTVVVEQQTAVTLGGLTTAPGTPLALSALAIGLLGLSLLLGRRLLAQG